MKNPHAHFQSDPAVREILTATTEYAFHSGKIRKQKMSRAAQANKNTITLKGSTEIVTEFFGYSINSILYQRGIYPPESFSKVQKYGLQMLVTSDSGLQKYLQQVLSQLSGLENRLHASHYSSLHEASCAVRNSSWNWQMLLSQGCVCVEHQCGPDAFCKAAYFLVDVLPSLPMLSMPNEFSPP